MTNKYIAYCETLVKYANTSTINTVEKTMLLNIIYNVDNMKKIVDKGSDYKLPDCGKSLIKDFKEIFNDDEKVIEAIQWIENFSNKVRSGGVK